MEFGFFRCISIIIFGKGSWKKLFVDRFTLKMIGSGICKFISCMFFYLRDDALLGKRVNIKDFGIFVFGFIWRSRKSVRVGFSRICV